ncbi:MAG: chemotaxis protein CheW [Deltaproteobacteria bacterium]|nr:chemotaxis protein CheW [Deltaproteobacteria bacterium]
MDADLRHVLFRAGGERFALPLESVTVVVPPAPTFAHVPRTGPPVLGVMSLRGRVVAVVEMAPLLGLPGRAPGDGGGQVLVLDRERRALGFLVDEVLGVEPVDLPDRSGERLPVKGLSTVRGSPVAVLDPDALAAAAQRLFRGPAA